MSGARIGWVGLGLVACLACSKKQAHEATPEPPAPSAVASAAPATALPSAEPAPAKPIFELKVGGELPGRAEFFPLTNGVVACVDCRIGDSPKTERGVFTFDGKELMKPLGGGVYRFTGELPRPLLVEAYGYMENVENPRLGTPQESRYFERRGASWVLAESVDTSNYPNTSWMRGNYVAIRELPRSYDEAMQRAPSLGTLIAGGKGPLLIARKRTLDRYSGTEWITEKAPWNEVAVARRLQDGRSLVLSGNDLFAVDVEGAILQVSTPDAKGIGTMFEISGQPWFTTVDQILVPAEGEVKLAPFPAREPRVKRPQPPPVASGPAASAPAASTSASPPGSAAPSPSAAPTSSDLAALPPSAPSVTPSAAPVGSANPEPATEHIPAMTGFSAKCTTPFVVLFTPPEPNWSYLELVRNLDGAGELQDKLWFAEFSRNGVNYFGAQAADEASARALMAGYQAKVPKSKPILGCLDMKAYLPDPYQPKWDAIRILMNLRAGFLL
jgi:hypothetical protein